MASIHDEVRLKQTMEMNMGGGGTPSQSYWGLD